MSEDRVFHLSIPTGDLPAGADLSALTIDRATARAANGARSAGLVTNARTATRIPLFAADVSPDAIGRAFHDRGEARRQVLEAFRLASAEFTNTLLRSSALSAPGAFPERDGAVVDVFFAGSDQPADTSWAQLFDVQDFRQTQEEDFELVDVSDAVSFRVYANGERVELTGVSGEVAKFPFALVGGGFQYLETWARDSKFWRIARGLQSMEVGYGVDMARLAWTVLTAASGLVTTARDTSGTTTLDDDVLTINKGMTEILSAMYTTDRVLPGAPRFALAYNNLTVGYADRVAAIMAAGFGVGAGITSGENRIGHPLAAIGSPNVPTGGFYLVFPKRKLKTGIRQDLEIFEDFEPTNLANARIGWGRYTHVRGDANQVRFIPLS